MISPRYIRGVYIPIYRPHIPAVNMFVDCLTGICNLQITVGSERLGITRQTYNPVVCHRLVRNTDRIKTLQLHNGHAQHIYIKLLLLDSQFNAYAGTKMLVIVNENHALCQTISN